MYGLNSGDKSAKIVQLGGRFEATVDGKSRRFPDS
jgi:hypothetical protein